MPNERQNPNVNTPNVPIRPSKPDVQVPEKSDQPGTEKRNFSYRHPFHLSEDDEVRDHSDLIQEEIRWSIHRF
jgi:hypothetical protein